MECSLQVITPHNSFYNYSLIGTNDKDILTFDVKELLEAEPYNFDASSMGMSENMFEEEKQHVS